MNSGYWRWFEYTLLWAALIRLYSEGGTSALFDWVFVIVGCAVIIVGVYVTHNLIQGTGRGRE